MNPCTLNFYLPILLPSGTLSTALNPSSSSHSLPGSTTWAEMDINFRRSLPDEWYTKRLIYRGLIGMACEGVEVIDGLEFAEGEREKAKWLIDNALDG